MTNEDLKSKLSQLRESKNQKIAIDRNLIKIPMGIKRKSDQIKSDQFPIRLNVPEYGKRVNKINRGKMELSSRILMIESIILGTVLLFTLLVNFTLYLTRPASKGIDAFQTHQVK